MAPKTTIHLEPGTYFAGLNRPWYASRGAVRSRLKAFGFTNVRFYDRDSKAPPVNPKLDTHYREGWDEWARADYTGAVSEKKAERVWHWLVKVPRAQAEKTPAIATPDPEVPSKKGGSSAALALLPASVAGWIWFRARRR